MESARDRGMIKPIALSATHMECRDLHESMAVLTDLLAFEKVAEKPGEAILKHPNTHWLLVVHEAGPDAPTKQLHNHWGVRVATTEAEIVREVDQSRAGKEFYPFLLPLLAIVLALEYIVANRFYPASRGDD